MGIETKWVERDDFFKVGIERIIETDVILDIGCGIRPHDYINPFIYICCEPYHEYVEVLKSKIENDTNSVHVILNYDWEAVVNNFGNQSVDTVFILDVIEHLDKETGERLLKLTENIARKQIVIFTPLGFVENETLEDGKDAWGLNGAAWQEHKSGWLPEDFDESWEIVACKDFHVSSNIGGKIDEPFGAFWAIKTIKDPEKTFPTLENRNDNILPLITQQGKHIINLLKLEKEKLEQDNINLNNLNESILQEKLHLEENITGLSQESLRLSDLIKTLSQESLRLSDLIKAVSQEKDDLAQKLTLVSQEKSIIVQEKLNLYEELEKLKNENLSLSQNKERLEKENLAFKQKYRFFERFSKK